MDAPFGHWNSQTFIAGLTQNGLIAPWVIRGAMDGPAFAACVEKVLLPELWSSWTTSRHTGMPGQPRPSSRLAAGFSTCRHTPQT